MIKSHTIKLQYRIETIIWSMTLQNQINIKIRIEGNIENGNCYCIRIDYDDNNEEVEEKEEEEEEEEEKEEEEEEKVEDEEEDVQGTHNVGKIFSLAPRLLYFFLILCSFL